MVLSVIDYTAVSAHQAFADSLVDTGFAVLDNHPVSQDLIDEIYSAWLCFFKVADKQNYAFDEKTHAGFVSTARSETAKGCAQRDLKEFYHYFPNKQCPEHLRDLTQSFFEAMQGFAVNLLLQVEQRLPTSIAGSLSQPLATMIERSNYSLLRILHYPPLTAEADVGAVRAAAHEDIDLLTLLPAATAKGLQVQLKDGTWQDVPCQRGWMIINVGDMLQECTQGYFRATSHRVINPTGDVAGLSRVSCPLFLHPRDDVVLSDRYTAGSYRQERFAEIGLVKS